MDYVSLTTPDYLASHHGSIAKSGNLQKPPGLSAAGPPHRFLRDTNRNDMKMGAGNCRALTTSSSTAPWYIFATVLGFTIDGLDTIHHQVRTLDDVRQLLVNMC